MKDKFNKFRQKAEDKLARRLHKTLQAAADPKQALEELRHKAELALSIDEQLVEAASRADAAAVTKLLLQGADINHKSQYSGNTALSWVIGHSDTTLAEFLLDHGADPRIDGKLGPLLCAAPAGLIPRLLDLGCNPNAADHYGTPLLRHTLSCDGDSILAVKALLAKGADPNAGGFLGATPLGNALFAGAPAMVSDLLKAGAKPRKDDKGYYPEIISAQRRYDVLEEMDRRGYLPGDWPTMAEFRQGLRLAEQAVKDAEAAAPKKPRPSGPKL